jgi:hypothetical protein
VFAQTTPQAPAPEQAAVKIPPEQLDALVAPIALYPDPLLSQTLVASTYPLEIIQLQQWLDKNKDLAKDQKKLAEKVAKQPWDPSIQSMAALPEVVKWLAGDIQWTTDLGNAFLAQQPDVMEAVQRMRGKAKDKGALVSNEQQKVETQTVESKTVIVIEQANPQIVYVPSYNPTYVYGAIGYPYPPIYYPTYSTGAVIAAGAISFGVGLAIGAAWGNGGWGYGCGWGHNDINVNVNNNFNRNTNINGGNRNNINTGNRNNINGGNRNNINNGSGNKWQHNPTHRGGAPYGDRGTANKFGGAARGDSLANRQQGAQRQLGQNGGNLRSTNPGVSNRAGTGNLGSGNRGAGVSDRSSNMGGNRGSGNNMSGNRGAGVSDRSGSTGRSNGNSMGGNRSGGISDRSSSMGGNRGGGGSNSIGNRSMSSGSGNRSFGGGGSGGWGGGAARSSSSRGMSSMGGGGGGFRGGGGGGRMGGGGGRRR